MTKRYHSQHEICHLWAEQSPDCTSAELRSGNLSFEGPTITSFGWWPLAHWTGRTVQEPRGETYEFGHQLEDQGKRAAKAAEIVTKRVLLRNRETHGRSGWNSDGKQQRIIDSALRGREDYVEIGVSHDLLKRYIASVEKADRAAKDHRAWVEPQGWVTVPADEAEGQRLRDVAWHMLSEERLAEERAVLKARAQRYAKPTVHVYADGNHIEGSDDAMNERIGYITPDEANALMVKLGLNGVAITETELESYRQIIRDGYAKYNDPKKAKARERNAKRGSLISLQGMVNRFLTNQEGWRYHQPKVVEHGGYHANSEGAVIIALAFRDYPEESAKLMRRVSEALAIREQVTTEMLLHPDANAVVRSRLYGRENYITPDQWVAGEKGTIGPMAASGPYDHRTYVRVEGVGGSREIVTSLGARVPFKDGVRLYTLASRIKAGEITINWNSGAVEMKAGPYQVNSIDAEGNAKIGCHRLCFTEMERLAVREVPHLVKPRYPVPALVSIDITKFAFEHSRSHAIAARARKQWDAMTPVEA